MELKMQQRLTVDGQIALYRRESPRVLFIIPSGRPRSKRCASHLVVGFGSTIQNDLTVCQLDRKGL